MPHRQQLSAQARALPCRIKKSGQQRLAAGRENDLFFTVLLTGCGSKLSAAFYGVIGNCRLLILCPALVGLVFGLGVLLRLGKQNLGGFSGKLSSREE